MTADLACVACMVDPTTTSMVVPVAQATLIAVPFFFRSRIAAAVRRVVGRGAGGDDPSASLDGQDCDTPADDGTNRAEPPGALRP
jgi:hypothetical protein